MSLIVISVAPSVGVHARTVPRACTAVISGFGQVANMGHNVKEGR